GGAAMAVGAAERFAAIAGCTYKSPTEASVTTAAGAIDFLVFFSVMAARSLAAASGLGSDLAWDLESCGPADFIVAITAPTGALSPSFNLIWSSTPSSNDSS